MSYNIIALPNITILRNMFRVISINSDRDLKLTPVLTRVPIYLFKDIVNNSSEIHVLCC